MEFIRQRDVAVEVIQVAFQLNTNFFWRQNKNRFELTKTELEEEKKYAKEIEAIIREKGGPLKNVRWARATFVMTILFTIMTCLVHFYKADFVNLTVCAIAIHLLSNAKEAQPKHFRYLVAGTILSFVYDVLWLILRF